MAWASNTAITSPSVSSSNENKKVKKKHISYEKKTGKVKNAQKMKIKFHHK